MGNCFYRDISVEDLKIKYKYKPNTNINSDIIDCKHKYNRHCFLGISYGIASVGATITTCIFFTKTAPATVPAAFVSGFACIDNIKLANNYKIKKKVLKNILKERKILIIDNNSNISYITIN